MTMAMTLPALRFLFLNPFLFLSLGTFFSLMNVAGAFSFPFQLSMSSRGEQDGSPAVIKVVGVGGAGGNAVNGMAATTTALRGVEFILMNTDQQAMTRITSLAASEYSSDVDGLAIGTNLTGGLGAGGKPDIGYYSALESRAEIEHKLAGADMVFVTAGMGGGTGTGAAGVVASIAKDLGCLTVGVVTRPFDFEGAKRSKQADLGIEELKKNVDTLLVVENDRLLQLVPNRMKMTDAFLVADDILRQGVIGTSEIIARPGLINVDFADITSVIRNSGRALIGVGTGTGPKRAEDAAVGAIFSPLLEYPINGATGIIFNIVGGPSLSLTEVNAAAEIVMNNVDPSANIIIGALIDDRATDEVSVTVLATGFEWNKPPGSSMMGKRVNGSSSAVNGRTVYGSAVNGSMVNGSAPPNGGTHHPHAADPRVMSPPPVAHHQAAAPGKPLLKRLFRRKF